jgi:protein-S-isoprenylcysteine O-methyltransferase Ste14
MKIKFDIYIDLIIIAFTLLYIGYHWTGRLNEIIGVCVTFLALLFWIKARIDLGKAFSLMPKTASLITKGLYRKIRNPMYLFGSIAIFGLLIALNNVYLYIIFLALLFIQGLRSRKEEALLLQKFGEKYLTYKKQTWF